MVKKKQKLVEVVTLRASEKLFRYVNGETNSEVLEEILEEASEEGLEKTALIYVGHDKRVRGCDPDNPEYELIQKPIKLSILLTLYKRLNGKAYVPPTPEEKEQYWKDFERQARKPF